MEGAGCDRGTWLDLEGQERALGHPAMKDKTGLGLGWGPTPKEGKEGLGDLVEGVEGLGGS